MANAEIVHILEQGTEAWNVWHAKRKDSRGPALSGLVRVELWPRRCHSVRHMP
jgi:hypothetical protein